MFAVIRMRGVVKARKQAINTLKLLRLHRKMHCVVIPDNPSYKGMIQAAKDYITWGTISENVLQMMVTKRGRKPGNVRLNADEANRAIAMLKEGKKPEIVPVFRLTPPRGGFKHSIKHSYPRGEIGNRKDKINELLEKMI